MSHDIAKGVIKALLLTACLTWAPAFAQTPAPKSKAEAPLDPAQFDKFTGVYQLGPYLPFRVRRMGNRFFLRFRNQRDVVMHPTGPTTFVADSRGLASILLETHHPGLPRGYPMFHQLAAKAQGEVPPVRPLDFQVDFDVDPQGTVTGFVLPENDPKLHAHRIDTATAEKLETMARFHIDGRQPTPGATDLLRRHLASLLAGTPDYDDMTPELAADIRQRLPEAKADIDRLGAVKTVWFSTVTRLGADVYNVTFEHGAWECEFTVAPDGKIFSLDWQPGSHWGRWWNGR